MNAKIYFLAVLLMLGDVLPLRAAEPDKDIIFPIAVWMQNPSKAQYYKAIGINRYVGLWQGPTAEQLTALERAGMPVICAQNAEALKPRWQKEVIGWLQADEPDDAQPLPGGGGYGPPITPEQMIERYKAMKAADPSRPVLLGLSQGVAWDGWIGRGVRTNKPEDYPRYIQAGDIIAYDIYPVVHDNKEVAGKLWYVGYGVKRLVDWTQNKKPVWADIECTHISNPKIKPTPQQVKTEVWMAIIHGARGIDYFVHQFQPNFAEAALLDDVEMTRAVSQINMQIQELAPVLLGPAAAAPATWEAAGGDKTPIAAMTRSRDGVVYVFAVGMSDKPAHVTFALNAPPCDIDVLSEDRHIPLQRGHWSDDFAGYEVHLYRIAAPAK